MASTMMAMNESFPHETLRDGAARAVGALGLTGIGLIHLLDLQSKFSETPYMAWMYIGLIVSALVIASELIRTGARRAWLAGAGLAAGAMVGFTLTRTVGLPQAHGDIGNWLEPLGLASLYVEAAFIALAGLVLGAGRVAGLRTAGRARVAA
ncbi:MAG: hypothetical protein QOF76_4123 [Solirubrobacteraceae bacterium]|jgi:hypothetical protein|nr:hypothetical protein [Solirubrobacteraceae bacterium]